MQNLRLGKMKISKLSGGGGGGGGGNSMRVSKRFRGFMFSL